MIKNFKCTSTDNYDRHFYEIVTKSNQKIRFDYWEDVQNYWYSFSNSLDTVLIHDRPNK
jgi:hypothetical protein